MKMIKPKFWDLKQPSLISYLLLPFTLVFEINNFLLKFKTKKKNQNIKTICVGNIYVGGTGKTPTTIKLFQILKKLNFDVSTAKKIYMSQRDERIILSNKTDLIEEKSRKKILKKKFGYKNKLLIFDDGLQDKTVSYDLEFVCFDSENWIGNGFLMPSGPLREKLKSLKKYDCVFLKEDFIINQEIITQIYKENKRIKIFKTYLEPINLDKFNHLEKYVIFSGIGNPQNFKKLLLKHSFNIIKEIIYPDHFEYNENSINKIKELAKNLNAKIITTEKDYVKLSKDQQKNIHYLEVELKIKNENSLIDFLKSKVYE